MHKKTSKKFKKKHQRASSPLFVEGLGKRLEEGGVSDLLQLCKHGFVLMMAAEHVLKMVSDCVAVKVLTCAVLYPEYILPTALCTPRTATPVSNNMCKGI